MLLKQVRAQERPNLKPSRKSIVASVLGVHGHFVFHTAITPLKGVGVSGQERVRVLVKTVLTRSVQNFVATEPVV